MSQVFLSYSRQDEATARRVAKALGATGHDVWWDADLPAHRAYSDVIETNLKDAKAVVVLWSGPSAQSQWVRAEADFARGAGKLVQAQLDGTLPPMPFNQIQCADLTGWRGSAAHPGWSKLSASVAALVSGEDRPAAATVASPWWSVSRTRWLAAMGAVLLLVAAFAVQRFAGGGETARPVVAVLPFESLDSRDESLVAGIWEDTRQAIGRNPQLLVLGPNTAEEIAEKGGAAARNLADYLVEASVRSTGDRIRVSANLVRTEDGSELWSKNFDRRLDDVFALQSEIAGEIEGHIRGRLAERGGKQPENIATSGEVYALYSDARAKIRKRQISMYPEAHKQLEQVVRMDPNFAPGWATLAVATTFTEFGRVPDARETKARPAPPAKPGNGPDQPELFARRAIALAPNLAAGHAALGFALNIRGPVAIAALRRATKLDPNDIEALNWLANSLDESQTAERLKLYSRIVEIEPLWWPAILNKLGMMLSKRDFAAAEQERLRLIKLGAVVPAAMAGIAINNAKGDLSAAAAIGIAAFKRSSANDRAVLGTELGFLLLRLGYFDEVEANFQVPAAAPFLWRNDPRGIDMIEALNLAPQRFFSSSPLTESACRVYVASGRGARLAELYRSAVGSPEEFAAVAGNDILIELAPLLALALRESGDSVEADRLLSAAEAALKAGPGRPWAVDQLMLARVYAVQGHKDATSQLVTAVEGGWIPSAPAMLADIALDPALALLEDEPQFQRVRKQILGHIAKERAELGPLRL